MSTVAAPQPGPWELELPWRSPPLSENKRMHYMAVHRLRKQILLSVHILAMQAQLPKGLAKVGIVLHWQATVKRQRDTDNPTPTLKAAIDALTRYGLVEDDDSEHVTSGCVIEQLAPSPRLWIAIHDLSLRDGPTDQRSNQK